MPQDPTYRTEEINANPIWKLAFQMSEWDNDNAPIGWFEYYTIARFMLEKYELKEKNNA